MARKKNAAPKPRTFQEELPVRLAKYEVDNKRAELEDIALKRSDIATKKDAFLKTVNAEDKKLEITYDQLLDVLRDKAEKRMVNCVEDFDLDTNRAVTTRGDTQEIVRERALDGEERARLAQGELPVEDQPNGADRRSQTEA